MQTEMNRRYASFHFLSRQTGKKKLESSINKFRLETEDISSRLLCLLTPVRT